MNVTNPSIIFNQKKINNDNIIIRSDKRVNVSEYSTCSQITFYERFNKILKTVTNDIDNFDFSNIVFAGGLMSAILEKDFEKNNELYQHSDIDIFVFGLNQKNLLKKMQYLYDTIQERHNYREISFSYPNSMVVSIVTLTNRTIQIIGSEKKSAKDVIADFDLTHCQVGYCSEGLIHTDEFLEAITKRVTTVAKDSINAYRLVKAHLRGYDVKLETGKQLYIKNYYSDYIFDDNRFPINTDKIRDPLNLDIKELLDNDTVKMNLNKHVTQKKLDCYSPKIENMLLEQVKEVEQAYGKKNIIIIKGNTLLEMKSQTKIDLSLVKDFRLQRTLLS